VENHPSLGDSPSQVCSALGELAATALPTDAAAFASLGDDELLAAQRTLAATRRAIEACAAVVVGEAALLARTTTGDGGARRRVHVDDVRPTRIVAR
jgi:hypothetical protein